MSCHVKFGGKWGTECFNTWFPLLENLIKYQKNNLKIYYLHRNIISNALTLLISTYITYVAFKVKIKALV